MRFDAVCEYFVHTIVKTPLFRKSWGVVEKEPESMPCAKRMKHATCIGFVLPRVPSTEQARAHAAKDIRLSAEALAPADCLLAVEPAACLLVMTKDVGAEDTAEDAAAVEEDPCETPLRLRCSISAAIELV